MSFIELIALQKPGVIKELTVFYGGKPWLSTRHGTEELLEKRQQRKSIYSVFSCQGLGASVWW
jgi:hypothetical protein